MKRHLPAPLRRVRHLLLFIACAALGCGEGPGILNHGPIAVVGPGGAVSIGDRVTAFGDESFDPDGDHLIYRWSMEARPASSIADVEFSNVRDARFVPDAKGVFELQLVVSDGSIESAPARVQFSTEDQPPVARAWLSTGASRGELTLDGRASRDPEGAPLSFAWTIVAARDGSNVEIVHADRPLAAFRGDRLDGVEVLLTVSDGANTARDAVVVTTNRPPSVEAGRNLRLHVGAPARLNGSIDSAEPRRFEWRVHSEPSPGALRLEDLDSNRPLVTATQPGIYVLEMSVEGERWRTGDLVAIEATADPPLLPLPDDIVGASHARSLERIVAATRGGRILVIDPLTSQVQEIELPKTISSLSVDDASGRAWVGHDGSFSVVDVRAVELTATMPVTGRVVDVVGFEDHAHAIVSDDGSSVRSYHLGTGDEHTLNTFGGFTSVALHAAREEIYLSAYSEAQTLDISAGPASMINQRSFHANFCWRAWLAPAGDRLYTACGTAFALPLDFDARVASPVLELEGSVLHVGFRQDPDRVAYLADERLPGQRLRVSELDPNAPLQIVRRQIPATADASGPIDWYGRFVFVVRDRLFVIARSEGAPFSPLGQALIALE